ncbi:MAG: nuclear transport factor 2 family protein [Terriglobales bacterium]
MAIINLINSYSDNYDHGHLNNWFDLFTGDARLTVCMGNADPVTVSGEGLKEMLTNFRRDLVDNQGKLPRHILSNVSVKAQSANTAEVTAYMTYVPLVRASLYTATGQDAVRITGTAFYRFRVAKGATDGVWRINEYTISFDQTHV